jgi:hypothetical protein
MEGNLPSEVTMFTSWHLTALMTVGLISYARVDHSPVLYASAAPNDHSVASYLATVPACHHPLSKELTSLYRVLPPEANRHAL